MYQLGNHGAFRFKRYTFDLKKNYKILGHNSINHASSPLGV